MVSRIYFTEDVASLLLAFCSAWSKSKSKELNFGFGSKQNTKVTFDQPPLPPTSFKKVPGKVEEAWIIVRKRSKAKSNTKMLQVSTK